MNTHRRTTHTINTGNNAITHTPPLTVRQRQARLKHRQRGFTAIELGVVLLVIGILTVTVFQTLSGMVSDAKFSAMGDQLVASSLRLQQRYITAPAGTRYNGMTLTQPATMQTLTEELREAINSSGVINLSDTGTAALAPSSATGGTGQSNLLWTLATLELEECKILIRKLAPPARVILSGTGTVIRSRPGDDPLLRTEIDTTCDNTDEPPTNTFQAVF